HPAGRDAPAGQPRQAAAGDHRSAVGLVPRRGRHRALRRRVRARLIMRAVRFVFALLLAPCIALAQPAKPFGAMLGLQVKFAQGQPLTDLPSLEELGVRWVRDVVPWTEIEPTAGRYVAFSPKLKQRLAYYRQHDIGVVALLTLSNPTAYPATADNRARDFDLPAFGRYAAAVAQLLRNEGVRFVIELGNEPHNSGLAKRLGGQW